MTENKMEDTFSVVYTQDGYTVIDRRGKRWLSSGHPYDAMDSECCAAPNWRTVNTRRQHLKHNKPTFEIQNEHTAMLKVGDISVPVYPTLSTCIA